MSDEELELLMRRVLVDAIRADWEGTDEAPAFEVSGRYQRQMDSMLKNPVRWMERKRRPFWKTALRQAAAVLLFLSVGFGCMMAAVPSARAAVVRWFIEWYDTNITYRYSGELPDEEVPVFEITALPEGFVETIRDNFPAGSDVVYENSQGDVIYFDYFVMYQGAMSSFITEGSAISDIRVNQWDGQYFEADNPEEFNTITWIDEACNMQFSINGCFEKSVILHMAESVSLAKTPK